LHKEPHIAVDQGVELVRDFAPRATGFANKVLREITKLRQDFPFGDPSREIGALAHQLAFPLWLAERLVTDLGFDVAAGSMAASNTPAPVFIADLVCDATVTVVPSELPAWMERIEAGECIIADASSQKVATLATPPASIAPSPASASVAPVLPFLEVGSGRGTKTVLLQHNALRVHGVQPPLFALDLHAFKREILQERIRRYHLENVTAVVGDATRLDELIEQGKLPQTFSAALIDAPCSGTGTLRRHPEIRWRLAPEDVTAMAAQGLAMLKAVARHLAPGGFVLYSTCSVLCEENEQVVEAFLASEEGAGFRMDPIEGAPCLRSSLSPNSPDAHFAARLIRRS
jgi:16S rRNA (cytosine967-C5)-methyltransferase